MGPFRTADHKSGLHQQKRRLHSLIVLSLPLLILNAAEKRLFGFEVAFGHVKAVFAGFAAGFASPSVALFYVIAGLVFCWLLTAALLLSEGRGVFVATSLLGLLFASEVHQVLFLILHRSYYPGMVSGLLFCVLGIFILRESYRGFQANRN